MRRIATCGLVGVGLTVALGAASGCLLNEYKDQPPAQWLRNEYKADPFPLTRELAAQEIQALPPTVRGVPPTPALPPAAATLPASTPSTPPAAPAPVAGQARARLTVVNVRPEAALLFRVSAEGELSFVEKLAPGMVIDLDTKEGVRWAAVFAEKPASQSFRVRSAEAVWLLRAPATHPVTPATPVVPAYSTN